MDENGEIGVIDPRDLYSDEEIGPDDSVACVNHTDSVLAVALSPTDRSLLVTGGQDDVAIMWTMQETSTGVTCTEKCRLLGHTDSVVQVGFSHDGQYVATASYDATVRIWTASSGALLHALDGPGKEIEWLHWHPKGHAIIAGSADGMAWMWWAPSGKVMQIFTGHASSVTCGCWGLGGKVVVTGSEDQSVIVWNPRTGTPQNTMRQVHEVGIVSICAHEESPVVVSGATDATVKVLQLETGKTLANLTGHVESVEAVGFNTPAVGGLSLLATGGMDGKVMIWDGKSFDLRHTLKEHFERGGVVRFKWLPPPLYANWLCTCSTDATVRMFNALTGECVKTLQGHSETVLDLDLMLTEVAGKGPQLVVSSASEDQSCRLFVVALWTSGKEAGPSSVAAAAVQSLPPAATLAPEGASSSSRPGPSTTRPAEETSQGVDNV